MNRKFIIGLASFVFASFGMQAQTNSTIFFNNDLLKKEIKNSKTKAEVNEAIKAWKNNSSQKTTGSGGARIVNLIDAYQALGASPSLTVAPMFNDSTAKILFSNGTTDYNFMFGSCDIVTMSTTEFNLDAIYAGEIDMGKTQNKFIKIDTVTVYGFYGRNDMSTTDSIILNFTESSGDLVGINYWPTWAMSKVGVDTLRLATMEFNQNTNEGLTSGGTRVALPLNTASLGDTIPGGLSMIKFPVGVQVSNLDQIGSAVSFKYSGSWNLGDTMNQSLNYFNIVWAERNQKTYPIYDTSGQRNFSGFNQTQNKYTSGSVFSGRYFPAHVISDNDYPLDYLYVDYHISCADCEILNVVDRKVNLGKAYPNPASTVVNLPIELVESGSVNVSIVNLLGQEVSRQDFGKMSGNQLLELPTAHLESGLYMVNIMVDGISAAATKVTIK